MTSTIFEIIEISEGEFVLRRSGTEDEPLVRIQFSPESIEFLGGASPDVAKAMIEAGLHEVEDIMDQQVGSEEIPIPDNRVLH